MQQHKGVTTPLVVAVIALVVAIGSGWLAINQGKSTPATSNSTSTLQKVEQAGVLKVGMAQTQPGAYKDVRTGQWVGINVEAAKAFADFMGVKLEIVETTFDLFIPALNSGNFDIFMPGTFYTGQRSLKVAYTVPAYYKGVTAVVRANDKRFDVGTVEVFNQPDVRIAVRTGAVEAGLAPKLFSKAKLVSFSTTDTSSIAEAVKVGNADVWFADQVLQGQYVAQNSWSKRVGPAFGSTAIGYVVRYGDPDWLSYTNGFVNFLRSSGALVGWMKQFDQDPATINP